MTKRTRPTKGTGKGEELGDSSKLPPVAFRPRSRPVMEEMDSVK